MGLVLTALLTFIAFTSAMVTWRMQGRISAFALDSERARLRTQILLESSGEGVFGLDVDGRCTFLNPAGAQLIGYSDDEVLGRDLRDVVAVQTRTDPADGGYLETSGFAGGPVARVEETLLTRQDGANVEAESLTSPIIEQGKVKGAVITLRDIGRRKAVERERIAHLEAEQALRERAEEAEKQAVFLAEAADLFATSLDYDTTLESVSRLVVPKIADSCVIYLMDDASGAIQRLKPAHVDPKRQRILQEQFDRYPPHLESLIPPVRRALLQGESTLVRSVDAADMKGVPGDQSHQSVMGVVGLQSLIVVPMRARGRIAGAISIGVVEPNRQFGPDDLRVAEVLVSRAALALDNARLYQQSQAAVSARNEVLGIVSHDLRNPLNAVRFGAQALLRHWPPMGDGGLERNQLSAITKAADRMHRLIRDLLDVAQIDVGRLAVEIEPIPAGILLEDAIELIHHSAAEKSITVTCEATGDLPLVNADGVRILQVFSNLLNNAVKFSAAGSTIVLGAERQEGEVVFSVRDQGRGIEPDLIPHIFNRFWRARNDSREGAGLGLAIARGIVESHDGRIWVESTVGTGSTFYFALPIAGRRSQPQERVLRAG
jgi:PAS domain S-box-containing protein